MKEFPRLETERLILRPFELSDSEFVHKYVSDYDVAKMTLRIPHPYPEGLAESWIREHCLNAEDETSHFFAIEHRESQIFTGVISIHKEADYNSAEIGYWIGKPFWGKGYMTEAAKAVIEFGFETLKINRIYAGYFAFNPASRRVQEKAGMTYEGTHRQAVRRGEEYIDLGMCGIIYTDYLRIKAGETPND